MRVSHFAGRTYVDGDLGHRVQDRFAATSSWSRSAALGDIAYDDLLQLVIHTPMDVRVFGSPTP